MPTPGSPSRRRSVSSSSRAHRSRLHSFPTRRSSDLGREVILYWRDLAPHQKIEVPLDLICRGADRKSTRLNSSHVSISYAVFCLKKKTDKKISRQNRETEPAVTRLQYMHRDLSCPFV